MKIKFVLIALAALGANSALPVSAQDYQDPKAAARKAQEDAWAKAVKEKARNDAIVEQQRAAERAAKTKATPRPATKPQ